MLNLCLNFIIVSIYIIFIWIVVYILSEIIPKLTGELQSVEKIVWGANIIKDHIEMVALNLDTKYNIHLTEHVQTIFWNIDLKTRYITISPFLCSCNFILAYVKENFSLENGTSLGYNNVNKG